jgi:hypothetical protein
VAAAEAERDHAGDIRFVGRRASAPEDHLVEITRLEGLPEQYLTAGGDTQIGGAEWIRFSAKL